MTHTSIQNSQVLQFKAVAKNFLESGFQPEGHVLLRSSGELDLVVFHGSDLPSDLQAALDVALPLSVNAKPANVVRFFQRPDVALLVERLHAGHRIEWSGARHVGVFSSEAQDAREGLENLLAAFNAKENDQQSMIH